MYKGNGLCAATPPLEAKKILLSMAVTEGIGISWSRRMQLDFVDVRRAYFNTVAIMNVYVKLPPWG